MITVGMKQKTDVIHQVKVNSIKHQYRTIQRNSRNNLLWMAKALNSESLVKASICYCENSEHQIPRISLLMRRKHKNGSQLMMSRK